MKLNYSNKSFSCIWDMYYICLWLLNNSWKTSSFSLHRFGPQVRGNIYLWLWSSRSKDLDARGCQRTPAAEWRGHRLPRIYHQAVVAGSHSTSVLWTCPLWNTFYGNSYLTVHCWHLEGIRRYCCYDFNRLD